MVVIIRASIAHPVRAEADGIMRPMRAALDAKAGRKHDMEPECTGRLRTPQAGSAGTTRGTADKRPSSHTL